VAEIAMAEDLVSGSLAYVIVTLAFHCRIDANVTNALPKAV